jgi:hypothetical protein
MLTACTEIMTHCHLCGVVQSTRRRNGASAESCIKFENILLVRVDLSWTEDVCIGSKFLSRCILVCGSMDILRNKELIRMEL